jgi:alpha-tubulin suppressor-like RCC1 family protein
MSLRYTGAWLQDGAFNPLTAPTPIYNYELYSWGLNNQGQLGLGNTTNYSSPKQVGSLSNWSKITIGYLVGFAIKTDGTLWSWGYNVNGQLGLGNTTYYSSPKQVGALTNWSKIGTGYQHNLAIKTDGTLWAWGANGSGQLGLGNTTNRSSPTQVGSLTWIDCAGGIFGSFGIRSDNTLWTWGASQGDYGQSGTGTAAFSASSPVQIGALTNWLKIAAAQYSTYAVKTDGTTWSWGRGLTGRLGLGNTTYYSSPKQVGALTNWLSVSARYASAVAIKTNGTLWTWGDNSSGQLGLGNTTNYSSPMQVGALTTWSFANAGYNSCCVALKTDGTLWAWGLNTSGQLGFGNTTSYSSPKQVGSKATWGFASLYGNSVLALSL